MEQVLQALAFLHNAPDPATKKEADDFLTKFQQTVNAWSVADAILQQSDAPISTHFFAAQTMRTKVQFDFYELPADSYVSLRDSLLGHISRFRASQYAPIHTMLAIAIADLAIQLDTAWADAVPALFNRFGCDAESYATLLEVLRLLPEECMNYKLMTDSVKRSNSRDRLQQAASQVIHFLLTLQCPTDHAKRKVLECFLSWIKFAKLQAVELSSNPLLPECFKNILIGGDLAETSTDIICEILHMSGMRIQHFQPVIQVILAQLPPLKAKFDGLLASGGAIDAESHVDALLQICRIYVEMGECLVPLIMEQINNQEILSILHVILQCTALPSQEISCIPFVFWSRLAKEIHSFHCRHPETDVQLDQFKRMYTDLLSVVIRRCAVSKDQDPFQADDDFIDYRMRLLYLAQNCMDILTPNAALEHVLRSLQEKHREGCIVQEAHFLCLTSVGVKAEVTADSVLWNLIQSLPELIKQQVDDSTAEGVIVQFTKKTAIELLGQLSNWLRTRPEFLSMALEMIAMLLLQPSPPVGCAPSVLERMKQVQLSASQAFKEICYAGKNHLYHMAPSLIQNLYLRTMQGEHSLPVRMHLFVVDGIACIVANIRQDEPFAEGLKELVMPLVDSIQGQRENPQVISDLLDRLTMIIRQIDVDSGSTKAVHVGNLISNGFWPVVRSTLEWHPGDSKAVEKSCRLLKHSMRCVADLFKPLVPAVASTLVSAFQAHQHSSYCYSAEILAHTYNADPEIVPVLTTLFHQLSSTALQCLINARAHLQQMSELVEDFYGMFERYLRYTPMIVLEAPTLPHTLHLLQDVIFVQQKEATEASIAFIESVLYLIAETGKVESKRDEQRARLGHALRPHTQEVMPGFVLAIFKLIEQVPTTYVRESLPTVLQTIRRAFPQELALWMEAGMKQLPLSVASQQEQIDIGKRIIAGDERCVEDAVENLCYRCEQVVLRNRGGIADGKR